MDIIFLHGLKVECVIGIWEWERRITQTLIFDLDIGFDIKQAARSGSIDDTLSYREVAKRVSKYAEQTKARLVETLAEGVAEIVLEEFGALWIKVRVNKRNAVTNATDVGVVIERGSQ
ncbi:MAG: dihydroneopterin aldolase [Acidiferrobacteraceae bacterium]|nr:dihydroneopterin aldolase [Acidiferrobacteraceae bacterium]